MKRSLLLVMMLPMILGLRPQATADTAIEKRLLSDLAFKDQQVRFHLLRETLQALKVAYHYGHPGVIRHLKEQVAWVIAQPKEPDVRSQLLDVVWEPLTRDAWDEAYQGYRHLWHELRYTHYLGLDKSGSRE